MKIGIREFKAKLSHYLDLVARGETVVVTNRGKPIARVAPAVVDEPSPHMKRLIAEGKVVYKGRLRLEKLPKPVKLLPGDRTMAEYISEQRGDPLRGY